MNVLTKTVLECSGDVVLHHFPILNFWLALFRSPVSAACNACRAWPVWCAWFSCRHLMNDHIEVGAVSPVRGRQYTVYMWRVAFSLRTCAALLYGIPEMSCRWFPSTAYLNHSCQGQVCQDQFKTRWNHFAIRCTAKPPWRCEDAIFRLN